MSTILPLRNRTAPNPPSTSPPSRPAGTRPLLDRWFLAWAAKAEARWVLPGYPHSRYY